MLPKNTEAIKTNSQSAESYFNFAVLRLEQKNPEAAKKLLEECLNIDKNFHDGKKLLQDIDNKGTTDWYKWWFTDNLKKKIFGTFLITFIMISVILANIINLANLAVKNEFISQDEILGFTITIALLFLLLLFPSIKKMKFKEIEVEISRFEYDIIIPNLIPPKPMEAIVE